MSMAPLQSDVKGSVRQVSDGAGAKGRGSQRAREPKGAGAEGRRSRGAQEPDGAGAKLRRSQTAQEPNGAGAKRRHDLVAPIRLPGAGAAAWRTPEHSGILRNETSMGDLFRL